MFCAILNLTSTFPSSTKPAGESALDTRSANRDARNTQSNSEDKSGEDAEGGITGADGSITDKQHADSGGKKFISFCLNLLEQTRINCFYAVASETKDVQSNADTGVPKNDAPSKEQPANLCGKEFHCFCMNFLVHSTANDNTFDITHRESICGYGW